ncbi:Holliday junction branch migration protein RuvA [Pseudofrankia sp. DC12]|uniref:Holliday junction branch migration protein RuvA n=1 Tax=Pseudofrankia sp. DC12 TaxID=683315 RepID=UPI0005F77FD3|nr:Holliday junction branch migration protein RuvA [Pseudofrankia sp. DC12]
MIASVAGTVLSVSPTAAVVEVGGVGLLVQCTPATLAGLAVGEPARLATALVVRETELTLYGFADADERDVYETLQGAAGVGPKLAQAVLGVLAPDEVRRAVADEDLAALTRVPGVGRKGAQRIVLDLKDKLGPPVGGGPARPAAGGRVLPSPRTAPEQVTDALGGLGYSTREAEDAVAAVLAGDGTDTDDVSALLRAALAVLRPR